MLPQSSLATRAVHTWGGYHRAFAAPRTLVQALPPSLSLVALVIWLPHTARECNSSVQAQVFLSQTHLWVDRDPKRQSREDMSPAQQGLKWLFVQFRTSRQGHQGILSSQNGFKSCTVWWWWWWWWFCFWVHNNPYLCPDLVFYCCQKFHKQFLKATQCIISSFYKTKV